DAAWDRLAPTDTGVFFVKKQEAIRDEINPDKHAYFGAPESGVEGYPVVIEAVHQIHCLNVLRKNLYFNHDFYAAQAQAKCPEENTPQCDHCVDFLRRRLMCTTDLGIVPLLWLGTDGRVIGDMSQMHTCRDFEVAR
ncbi:hypothetical protein EK21DRAFT_33411, partial [Setomelanomma holmii]